MKNSIKRCFSLLVAIVVLSSLTTPVHARQTGWINLATWRSISRTLDRSGEIPVAVQCKDTNNVSFNTNSGLTNVRIGKNPDKKRWAWAVGGRFGIMKPRLERDGYRMVSYCEIKRASGLVIKMGIWHKD